MKTTQVTSNSFQLTRLGLVNCYLVREQATPADPASFTLIDTGISGSEDAILAAANAQGAPIRRIVLTHAHTDHVGSVDALVKKLHVQGIAPQLAASARSIPLLAQPPNKSLLPGEPHGTIKGGLPGIKTPLTHTLSPGELFGSLRVFDTPGHIPGHISLLDERDGTLFAGDALVAVGKLAVSGFGPWYFPFPNLVTWSKPAAIASIRALANLPTDVPLERFACGHGAVRTGGREVLTQILSVI